eukprot:COSAG02_NODE_67715_length_252_cov_0.679739_1_plen_56_part_10
MRPAEATAASSQPTRRHVAVPRATQFVRSAQWLGRSRPQRRAKAYCLLLFHSYHDR